jgi:hypothetical protein
MNKLIVLLITTTLFATNCLNASPWIGTNKASLHQDLKTLVEHGHISAVSMSYPLPWLGIAEQVKKLEFDDLTPVAKNALFRLRKQLNQRNKINSQLKLTASSEQLRASDFTHNQQQQSELQLNTRFETNQWAGQLALNAQSNVINEQSFATDDSKTHLDQSYLAFRFEDWQIAVAAIDQWWGPAESNSLILSNNARPVPSLSISTSQATVNKDNWLSFLGPWYFTAQLGQLEKQRFVANTKLWKSRLNFRPFKQFEMGLSWSAMWGGEGYGNTVSDFFDVITFRALCADGSENCDESLHTKPGNHLAGIDLKYTSLAFTNPVNFYIQTIGEDAKDFYKITDRVYLYGISTYLWASKVFLETYDTTVSCGSRTSTTNNCFYEHGDYRSGYRHFNRAIGSSFDSDTRVVTLGLQKHYRGGDELELRLDSADLNPDGERPSPIVSGNSEKLVRLSASYLKQYSTWSLKTGGIIENSKSDGLSADIDYMAYAELVYNF